MENFAEKLKTIIINEGLSASKFAQKIGVQRSSVSHVLSGRNKPSLDFILKIHKSINNIDLEWLLSNKLENSSLNNDTTPHNNETYPNKIIEKDSSHEHQIDKIVFFFKDGSFKTYNN